jgi:hypothetical protein
MLFTKIMIALCVITSTAAIPIDLVAAADPNVVDDAFKRVIAKLTILDSQFKSVAQIPSARATAQLAYEQTTSLLILDWDVANELRSSTKDIQSRAPVLNTMQAANLVISGTSLWMLLQSTATNWIAVKPMVKASGRSNDVIKQLSEDADSFAKFADAMLKKLQSQSQSQANMIKTQIVAIIETVIKEYKKP